MFSLRSALPEDIGSAEWGDVGSKLLDQAKSMDIVGIIAAEDDVRLTMTCLMSRDCGLRLFTGLFDRAEA